MAWIHQFDATPIVLPIVQLPNIGQEQRSDKLRYESGAGFWNDPVFNTSWYWDGVHFYYVQRFPVDDDYAPNYYLEFRQEVERIIHNCPNVVAYRECERVDINNAIPLKG
jgi:hypothetical protein